MFSAAGAGCLRSRQLAAARELHASRHGRQSEARRMGLLNGWLLAGPGYGRVREGGAADTKVCDGGSSMICVRGEKGVWDKLGKEHLWLTATRRRAPSTASPSARHSTVSSPPPAAPPGQRTRTNAAAAAPGTSHAKRSASSSSSPEGARWWGGAPGGRLPATGTEPLIEVATATPRTRLQPVPVESGVLRRGSIG